MANIDDLRTLAQQIKNETNVGANTANRVGTTFEKTVTELETHATAIANEATARAAADANLQEQIDNIHVTVDVDDVPTPNSDNPVGSGGTYAALYDREEAHMGSDESFFITGKLISNTGALTNNNSYKVSVLIDIIHTKSITSTLVVSGSSYKGIGFYDADGEPISATGTSGTKTVTLTPEDFPEGTRYVRFNYAAAAAPEVTRINEEGWRDVRDSLTDYVQKDDLLITVRQNSAPQVNMTVNKQGVYTKQDVARYATLPFYVTDAEKFRATEVLNSSTSNGISFYDADMVYISALTLPVSATPIAEVLVKKADFPEGTAYVAVSHNTTAGIVEKTCEFTKMNADLTNAYLDKTLDVTKQGYISIADGTFVPNRSYRCVEKIFFEGDYIFAPKATSNSSTVASFAFFDVDGVFLSAVNTFGAMAPEGAAFVSASWNAGNVPEDTAEVYFVKTVAGDARVLELLDALREQLGEEQERIAIDTLQNTGKAVFIGDSITFGYGASAGKKYHDIFAQLTGMTNVNLGVSGATIGKRDGGVTQLVDETESAELTSDTKLVVIFGGTNDFGHSLTIGDLFQVNPTTGEKTAPSTTLTTAGGLHAVITAVQTKAPLAKIVLITPLPRLVKSGVSDYNSHQKNVADKYLADYADAIRQIAVFYNIPVLDLFSCANLDVFNAAVATEYFYDQSLHPNDNGHRVIGQLLYKFVRDYLNV